MKKSIALILSIVLAFGFTRKVTFGEEPATAHCEKECDSIQNVFEDISLLSKSYGEAKTNKERHLIIESKIAELETKISYLNKVKRKTPVEDRDKRKKINNDIYVIKCKIDWLKKLLNSTEKNEMKQYKIIASVVATAIATTIALLGIHYFYATRTPNNSLLNRLKSFGSSLINSFSVFLFTWN